jgi:UPF0755 protein
LKCARCYYRGKPARCDGSSLIQGHHAYHQDSPAVGDCGISLRIVGAAGLRCATCRCAAIPITFSIPAGASLRTAAQVIESAGVDLPAWQLELLGRVMGRSAKIKAGSYELESGLTATDLLDKLTRGDVLFSELVLVEGKNFRQLRALNEHPDLSHDTLKLSDPADSQGHWRERNPIPEGLFFPDTYLFGKGSSDLDVLRRAYTAMQPKLAEAWAKRESTTPLKSPYELLILASIVEKETGLARTGPISPRFLSIVCVAAC